MYCDPDGLLSWEELLEKIFAERMSPASKERVLRIAEVRGVDYMTVLHDALALFEEKLEDPVYCESFLAHCQEKHEREAMPFGPDPRMQGGDHAQ